MQSTWVLRLWLSRQVATKTWPRARPLGKIGDNKYGFVRLMDEPHKKLKIVSVTNAPRF